MVRQWLLPCAIVPTGLRLPDVADQPGGRTVMKHLGLIVVLSATIWGCSGGDGPVETKDAPVAAGAVDGTAVNPEAAGARRDAAGARSGPANPPGAGRGGGAPPPMPGG